MIKEIIGTTLLATAISNTTVIQNVNRAVTMDSPSTWVTQIQTDPDEYIYAYRNTLPQANIETSAFNIRQRALEYYINEPREDTQKNVYYFLLDYDSPQETADLHKLYLTLMGNVTPNYQPDTITWWEKTREVPLTNTVLQNYLNGTPLTTIAQYNQVISSLESEFGQYATPVSEDPLYINNLNNKQIFTEPEESSQYIWQVCYKVELTYEGAQLPLTQPYTPFNNYGTTASYYIQYDVDVPESGTGEIVDIPGFMFTILGMPFAFVSQAFNLTIFPGTAYAVNLSHIFLAIVGAGILIFVLKKILK